MSYRRYVRVPVEDLRDGVLDTAADHRPDHVVEIPVDENPAVADVRSERYTQQFRTIRVPFRRFYELTEKNVTTPGPIPQFTVLKVLEHDPDTPNPGVPISDEFRGRVNDVHTRICDEVWSKFEPHLHDHNRDNSRVLVEQGQPRWGSRIVSN